VSQNPVYPIVLRVAARYQRKTGATVDLKTIEITADNVEQVLADLVSDLDDLEGAETSLGLDLRNMIARMRQFQHNDDIHHKGEDVLTHTKWVLEDLASLTVGMQAERKTVVTLAALLHDLGKAYTYEFIDGKHTFRKHAEKSVEIAQVLLAKHREKLGGLYDRVLDLIRLHDAFMVLLNARAGASGLKYLNKFMQERVYLDRHLDDLLTLSKADSRRAQRYEDSLRDALGVLDDIGKAEAEKARQEADKAHQRAMWIERQDEIRALLEAEVPEAVSVLHDQSAVNAILGKAKRFDLINKLKAMLQ